MRAVAIAAIAIASCYHDPPPVLSNGVAVTASSIDDPLGLLPIDSELVFGADVAALRATGAWARLEPGFANAARSELDQFKTACGFDPTQTVQRFAVGLRMIDGERMSGVVVVRGVDTARILDCVATEFGKGGSHARLDRGVVIWKDDREASAWTTVGSDTLVVHIDVLASRESVADVVASGVPLRRSPHFLGLYDRLDHKAQVWGVLNGRSRMLDFFEGKQARPTAVTGTIAIAEGAAFHARLETADASAAAALQQLVGKDVTRAAAMFGRHDVTVQGDAVIVDLTFTPALLENLFQLAVR